MPESLHLEHTSASPQLEWKVLAVVLHQAAFVVQTAALCVQRASLSLFEADDLQQTRIMTRLSHLLHELCLNTIFFLYAQERRKIT